MDKMKVSGSIIPNSSRGKKPSVFTISDDRLEIVKAHILSFPCYESHYGRSKTNKKFLLPHLTLQDMYKSYRESIDNPVSLTIYSWVFKAQNLSFKTPSLDTCVKCDTLHMKIKFSEGTEREENEKLMKNHQKRAEKVYDKKSTDRALSIETRDTVVLAFDLQQCLPTPYLKSGAAFYKRPLWTYNLALRDCTTNTVYCFMWHEAIGGRVSLQRKRGKSPLPSVFNTECLPHSYDGPIPISDEKKRDLISLLLLINPSARSFYTDILSNKDIQDEHPLLNNSDDD
ncbi:hypothetical protein ACJJTC_002977 [Scirpophaga incertulas]